MGCGETASRLRAWRIAHGMNLEDAADLTGVSVSMLSRAERGKRRLTPLMKVQIARRLGVRVRDLFDADDAQVSACQARERQ